MNSDWPCKNCKHVRSDHGFIKPEDQIALHTACRVPDTAGRDYADGCSEFIPIDNLIYLEQKENNEQ